MTPRKAAHIQTKHTMLYANRKLCRVKACFVLRVKLICCGVKNAAVLPNYGGGCCFTKQLHVILSF